MTKGLTGTVKWYDTNKGFGFLLPQDGGRDIFVHRTALEQAGLRTLSEGQRVSFDLENDARSGKPKAVNLEAA